MIQTKIKPRRRNKYKQVHASTYDKKGNLISEAKNNYHKTHPIQAHFASLVGEPHRIFLHAEILALLRAGSRNVHSIHVSSVPCNVCMAAIKAWKIPKIVILTGDSNG